jgi:hypothetical protein
MRHTLWISALLVVIVGSACSRQNVSSSVPDTVVSLAMNRCTPTDLADVANEVETCAAKTMAGQRMRR